MKEIKILLVDDHPTVRNLLRAMLEGEGYQLIDARDGKEALRQSELERPDLVILDLMMPDITGERVIEELHKRSEPIPIIVVSAKQEALQSCRDLLGSENVFAKPFEPTRLVDRVGELLGPPLEE